VVGKTIEVVVEREDERESYVPNKSPDIVPT
jgi:hypothetical protein